MIGDGSEPNPCFFFNLPKGLPAVDDIKHENLGFFFTSLHIDALKKGLAKKSL